MELRIDQAVKDRSTVRLHGVTTRLHSIVPYAGFIIVLAYFSVALRSHGFLSVNNLRAIVEQTAPIAVMAMGYAFTLGAGEIDLSIGATVALVALTAADVMQYDSSVVGVVLALLIGLGVGLLNGFLTVLLRVPSFLVTLGVMTALEGFGELITNQNAVAVSNTGFNAIFGSGSAGPFPSLLIWVVAILAIGTFVMRQTRLGAHLLAIGGNRESAAELGLPVKRLRITALVISAFTAALAGLLYTGRLQGAQYTLGGTDLLTVIAATIIGGTSLSGGRASVPGAFVGALLLGVLNEGLILMGLAAPDQLVAEGIVVIVAVGLSLREKGE